MYQENIVAHLENSYLISPPWEVKQLPRYKPGQFLRSTHLEKARRCIGVCWWDDGWYYLLMGCDRYLPEYSISPVKPELFLPKNPCQFAIAQHVRVPLLLIEKTLVVGVTMRREWWGMDWCVWVQTRRDNVLLSQKDVEAIAE